jgi:hypothetical protein
VLFYDYEVGIILLKYLDILVIDKILLSVWLVRQLDI